MSLRLLLGLSLLCGGIHRAASAQSSPCRTDSLASWVTEMKGFYGGIDTASYRAQGLPVAQPANIVAVTDSATCAAGLSVYNQHYSKSEQGAYFVAIGSEGFALIDTSFRRGEYIVAVIYDSQWALKFKVSL